MYLDIIHKDGEGTTEMKLVKTFQQLGLIPRELKCPKNTPECGLKAKPARVVDRFVNIHEFHIENIQQHWTSCAIVA